MKRRSDRFVMLAVGAVAGVALTLLMRTSEASAQTKYVSFRTCTGLTYDSAYHLLYRSWSDGSVDYTVADDYNSATQTWHHRPWKPVQP
jgi:hypothetical protein